MKLTDADKAILDGRSGTAARKAMEILVGLGEIYGAERMLRISSVQVSGVSYHNLGDVGLEWLEQMAADGRARTLATLNPAGMDLEAWQSLGVPREFAERQLRVIAAYRRMRIETWCTCTPYLVGNLPEQGEHVAWSESSAVSFANSVLGARTNREGGPSALASALVGRTPEYGLHLDAERRPQIDVLVRAHLRGTDSYGALGCAIGQLAGERVPLIRGLEAPSLAELKALCAAAVTFGGSPLLHIEGLTPEADLHPRPIEALTVGTDDVEEARARLSDPIDEVDMVCLGCPHASLAELTVVARLLEGRPVKRPTWICTARGTADVARRMGLVDRIEESGARVVSDTCFAVAPLEGLAGSIATDSAKGSYYARGHNRLRVRHASLERCIAMALGAAR